MSTEGVRVKACTLCKVEKSLEDFWRHSRHKDGRVSQCKTCSEAKRKLLRSAKREKNREFFRAWREENREKFNSQRRAARNSDKENKRRKDYYARFPEKKRAHKIVNSRIYRGTLIRPKVCSVCNKENGKIMAHHEDYSKPLEIIWTCQFCHVNVLHRELYAAKA